MGLDYTEPEADWQEQRLFLEQLLGLMKGSLDRIPVVVHCRENNIPKRSARDELCGILETYLARDQEIQLHYFNGKPGDVIYRQVYEEQKQSVGSRLEYVFIT